MPVKTLHLIADGKKYPKGSQQYILQEKTIEYVVMGSGKNFN